MLIGTTSRLLMWFLVYISSLKVRAGITVALISRDAISGLSFLSSGASLYRVVPALAARFSMCRVGRSVLSKKTPTHLCSRLFGMSCCPNCVGTCILHPVLVLFSRLIPLIVLLFHLFPVSIIVISVIYYDISGCS